MKNKLPLLLILILLTSCKVQTLNKNEISPEIDAVSEKKSIEIKDIPSNNELSDCEIYWRDRFPKDSLKLKYINEIISKNEHTNNNIEFLNALKNQKEDELVFENVLTPIFRLSKTEIGLFSFPKYKEIEDSFIDFSKEKDLIKKFHKTNNNSIEYSDTIKFYPKILDSVFKNKSKPSVYFYTTDRVGSTSIVDLGAYVDECLEYYEYSIDATSISKDDKVLVSSPFMIDLIYENNKNIDLLIKSDDNSKCVDCPNSIAFSKTFAKLKGTTNLYFIYADTFPINNELDTPSRALIYINPKNEIIYLWYEEIDLFGCSCL